MHARFSPKMRHDWAKVIAAGYKQGETEAAAKNLIEAQQAIEVIDIALEELDDEELEEAEEGDDE